MSDPQHIVAFGEPIYEKNKDAKSLTNPMRRESMNEAFVKDLAEKRREYLAKKSKNWLHAALGIVFATLFAIPTGCIILSVISDGRAPTNGSYQDDRSGPLVLLIVPVFAACAGLMIYGGLHFRDAVKQVKSLPYVPPVAEQIAALPAEDILVRGSEQPASAPEELLRAAPGGKVDPAEELLRPEGELSALEIGQQRE